MNLPEGWWRLFFSIIKDLSVDSIRKCLCTNRSIRNAIGTIDRPSYLLIFLIDKRGRTLSFLFCDIEHQSFALTSRVPRFVLQIVDCTFSQKLSCCASSTTCVMLALDFTQNFAVIWRTFCNRNALPLWLKSLWFVLWEWCGFWLWLRAPKKVPLRSHLVLVSIYFHTKISFKSNLSHLVRICILGKINLKKLLYRKYLPNFI